MRWDDEDVITVRPYKGGFRKEKEMRLWVAENLELLEGGLHIHGDWEALPEFPLQLVGEKQRSGCIDILAVDRKGDFVVIECKNARAGTVALGQVIGYMAWVAENILACGRVRGILVVQSAAPALLSAIRFVPQLPIMVFECSDRGGVRRVL
ncbi:MAG: endonuclease NucS domain-containing protein [Fimbriimonadaceae bacterium]